VIGSVHAFQPGLFLLRPLEDTEWLLAAARATWPYHHDLTCWIDSQIHRDGESWLSPFFLGNSSEFSSSKQIHRNNRRAVCIIRRVSATGRLFY